MTAKEYLKMVEEAEAFDKARQEYFTVFDDKDAESAYWDAMEAAANAEFAHAGVPYSKAA